MLIFALLAVFIAGLMVGRTPEYLGKKIQAAEMKLVVLYILVVPARDPRLRGIASVLLDARRRRSSTPAPHGLREIVYAFTSAANNNGSAFGGLTGNTDWYNTTLGLAMLVGRFLLIVPVLAIAGSLARKQPVPAVGRARSRPTRRCSPACSSASSSSSSASPSSPSSRSARSSSTSDV